MKIKAVLNVVTRRRDVNGNTYHRATCYNTKTGESLCFEVGSESNARSLVQNAFEARYGREPHFDIVYFESVIPARLFDSGDVAVQCWEHEAPAMLREMFT